MPSYDIGDEADDTNEHICSAGAGTSRKHYIRLPGVHWGSDTVAGGNDGKHHWRSSDGQQSGKEQHVTSNLHHDGVHAPRVMWKIGGITMKMPGIEASGIMFLTMVAACTTPGTIAMTAGHKTANVFDASYKPYTLAAATLASRKKPSDLSSMMPWTSGDEMLSTLSFSETHVFL